VEIIVGYQVRRLHLLCRHVQSKSLAGESRKAAAINAINAINVPQHFFRILT
jgi:hypothetical protein